MTLLVNRAKANTATTGTGTATVGSAVSPYQSWSAAGAVDGETYPYLIEDGMAWETDFGVYASGAGTVTRPGTSSPQFASSTGALLSLSGSATIACVGNARSGPWDFKPPLAASFTLESSDATQMTLTDDAQVGLMSSTNQIAGPQGRWAYRTLTTKTSAWDMKVKIDFWYPQDNYSELGIFVRDSIGGKSHTVGCHSNSGPTVLGWTSLASAAVVQAGNAFQQDIIPWYRIKYDGTNYTFYWGRDGKNWSLQYTTGTTTYLGAAGGRVGIYQTSRRTAGTPTVMTVPYFSLTGPGV